MEDRRVQWRNSFLPALVIYIIGALVLLGPWRDRVWGWERLVPINMVLGSLGAWCLSRRWVCSVVGRVAAGAVYGFGPFALTLLRFHPIVCTFMACMPWSFCAWAYLPAWMKPPLWRRRLFAGVLLILPVGLVLFFAFISARTRYFVVPLHGQTLSGRASVAFFFPCVRAMGGELLWGYYHVALVPLILGGGRMLMGWRWTFLVVMLGGLVLAFLPPLFSVSPVLWLILPHCMGAVAVGMGADALVYAGFNDRAWLGGAGTVVLLLTFIGGALGLVGTAAYLALTPLSAALFWESAKLYALGLLMLVVVLFSVQLRLRVTWLRICVIFGALGTDLYLSARFVLSQFL